MRISRIARAVGVMTALLAAGAASASGFQLLEQNASGLGNAYAGSAAVAEDASTLFYNPAGMTFLGKAEISAGTALIRPSYNFHNEHSSAGVLAGEGNDAGGLSALPNLFTSYALSRDVYLGVGFGAPFGLRTEYDAPWIGAAQSLKFDVKTKNINPSVAWRVNDKVSLGAGLDYQKLDIDYERAVATVAAPYAASRARFKADDTAMGWNAGAIFTLSPATRIGLSYRSAMKYTVTGDLTVSGPVAALNAAGTSTAQADVKLPDTFILSVVQQLDERWQMQGDLSRTGWRAIQSVDIVRTSGAGTGTVAQTLHTDFRDTWRVALGGTYRLEADWSAKFGLAYDQSPVRSAETRLVSLPDNDRIWLTLGAQWRPAKGSRVDFGAAYLHIRSTRIHNDQTSSVATSNRGLVDGNYDGNAVILGVQYSQAF